MQKDLTDEMKESIKELQNEILGLKRAKDETLLYIDEEFARKKKRNQSRQSSYYEFLLDNSSEGGGGESPPDSWQAIEQLYYI